MPALPMSRPAARRSSGAGPKSDSPAMARAAPTTRTVASGKRRREFSATRCSASAAPADGATARIAGSVSQAATAISGRSPRKTSRQWNRLGHGGREDRGRDARQDPGRGQRREHPRPEAFRQRAADRDVRDRRDRARAEPLDDSGKRRGHPWKGQARRPAARWRTARSPAGTAGRGSLDRSASPRRRCPAGCRGRSPRRPSRRGRTP